MMNNVDVATFRELLKTELPRLLREHPESRHEIWGLMLEAFPSRQEFDTLLEEMSSWREDTNRHFEKLEGQVDSVQQNLEGQIESVRQNLEGRMDSVQQNLEGRIDSAQQNLEGRIDSVRQNLESQMKEGFQAVRQDIDRLGQRWGIRNESLFRQTIAALLEKSFGVQIESRLIDGEEFDVIISDGAHILVEITASAGPKTQKRLERKRQLYTEAIGIVPARVVLATASIHSQRAQALREAGFEVIEPEEQAME